MEPWLERLARGDDFISDKELSRAFVRTTDGGKQPSDLLARDKAKRAARRAGENGPIGIFLFADLAGVLEYENGARFHLFGNPLVDDAQFADHLASGSSLPPSRQAWRARRVRWVVSETGCF